MGSYHCEFSAMCKHGWRACVNMQGDVCVCGGEYAGGVGAVPVRICCVAVRARAVCGVSAGCLSAACIVSVRRVKRACRYSVSRSVQNKKQVLTCNANSLNL